MTKCVLTNKTITPMECTRYVDSGFCRSGICSKDASSALRMEGNCDLVLDMQQRFSPSWGEAMTNPLSLGKKPEGKKLLEKLAELEHEQWMYWSKAVAKKSGWNGGIIDEPDAMPEMPYDNGMPESDWNLYI